MCDLKMRGAGARSSSSALLGYVQLLSTQCSEPRSVAAAPSWHRLPGLRVSSTKMYDSQVELDLGYDTKQTSEARVRRERDSAYRAGVTYGGITGPSNNRYL